MAKDGLRAEYDLKATQTEKLFICLTRDVAFRKLSIR